MSAPRVASAVVGSPPASPVAGAGVIRLPNTGAKLPTERVTFRWTDSGDSKAVFFRAYFAAYQQAHPNITFQYDGLPWTEIAKVVPIGVQNGNAPDIFQSAAQRADGAGRARGLGCADRRHHPHLRRGEGGLPPTTPASRGSTSSAESGGAHVVSVLLFAGFFSQLPKELEEAAIMDGAGFLRIFWQIMLPLAKPVIATTIILQLLQTWNSFLLPLVLTLSRPELRTLAVGIYSFRGEFFTDWSALAAAATISLVPIILVFLFLQRYFVQGIAGAVKQ